MKLETIAKRFKTVKSITYEGTCNDCKRNVKIDIHKQGKTIVIEGGAVYAPKGTLFFKCDACFEEDNEVDGNRTEVYPGVLSVKKKGKKKNEGR